ncbi:serum albumin-like [Rhinophrynus dorsalis]
MPPPGMTRAPPSWYFQAPGSSLQVTLFFNKICAVPDLGVHYKWSIECCAKKDPERHKCFRDHRNVIHSRYERPDPEETCKEYKEHKEHTYAKFIDETSKRHPNLYASTILVLSHQQINITAECCEAEDKGKCFLDRMTKFSRLLPIVEVKQKHTCRILDNFGQKDLQNYIEIRLSQKNPKASFELIQKLSKELTHLDEDCCHGDVLECMVKRFEVTKHICEHQKELSTKLQTCCEKSILERSSCIVNVENDEIPVDLPSVEEFIEDPKVCEKYAQNNELLVDRFRYEYSRRHPELSIELLLRISEGYQHLLDKCCKTDNPSECYKDAKTILANAIKESTTLLEENCSTLKKQGECQFEKEALFRYVKIMPQMDGEDIIQFVNEIVKVGSKCCGLPEKQRMPCADKWFSLIIGQVCETQKTFFINHNVARCCNESYAGRRPCIIRLGVDPTYIPEELHEFTFHFSSDLCTLPKDHADFQRKKLLVKLLQVKPQLTREKLDEITAEFNKMEEKCCAVSDHQECFDKENPLLIARCQQLLAGQ